MSDARLLDSRPVYPGKIVDLRLDRVELPNGLEAELEVIRHVGAAAVVPLDGAGRVVLVRQYRYAVDEWLLEVPAGKLDAGEEPAACVRRELEEETGLRAGRLESMGWIYTTPGFTDEKIWLFLARDLRPARQQLEADEILEVVRMPFGEAVAQARDGRIHDGKSVCSLLRAAERLEVG